MNRRIDLLAKLTSTDGVFEMRRMCEVGAEVTGTSGAGIMLMTGDVAQGSLYPTDDVSALLEDLQFTLGEGPGVEAHQVGRPVLEPDLSNPRTARWVGFAGPALEAGARAVFAFPLRIGNVRLGALDLYCDEPHSLTDEQHSDALSLSGIVTRAILATQAEATPGQVAVEVAEGGDFHYVVHQAAGMVAAQLEIKVDQALVRLRAHAFGHDRPLRDVAAEVVDRRLRFDGTDG